MLDGKVGLRLVEPTARKGSYAQATHFREGEAGPFDRPDSMCFQKVCEFVESGG